jgi:glucokinase
MTEVVSVMDIGGTHVSAANVDLTTRAILPGQHVRVPLDGDVTADQFVATLTACAAQLPAQVGRQWSIALPGPFDYERGIALYEGVGKFDALRGLDLRAALSGLGDISFHNDAAAFGLGEWWVGAARGHRTVAGISLGTGVGSCFLRDGHIVRDEPGLPPDGRIDLLRFEGKPLEETVSRHAIRRAYAQATGETAAPDVREIAQRARDGERAAYEVITQAMKALGTVLAPVLAAFDPTILVVGGSIAASWDLVADPLRAAIGERIAVEPATHPTEAPLLGAAYLGATARPKSTLGSALRGGRRRGRIRPLAR